MERDALRRADRRPHGHQRRAVARRRAPTRPRVEASIRRDDSRRRAARDRAARARSATLSLQVFDRTFAVTYALELAAVVIGLVGLSSSFGALVLARRREFGVLRHLGMTRRQIGAMLATEGLAVSAHRARRRAGARLRDQPDPDPRRQPAVVPLGHGAVAAVAGARRLRRCCCSALSMLTALASGRQAMGDGRRARGEGRLVSASSADDGRDEAAHASWRSPLALAARPRARRRGVPARRARRALALSARSRRHPEFRTEWWYVTGWVADAAGRDYGVQVTFFRNRPGVAEANPSAFAPRQLLFAHAALADPRHGRLLHDQRAARAGFGLAGADEASTRACIDDWSLALGRRPLRREDRRARVRARSRVRADAAAAAAGRRRVLAQGSGRRAGELLLQPAAARRDRHGDRRRARRSPSPAPRGSITNGRAT